MKKIIYALLIPLLFISCEKYQLDTYPTLDGTYVVSWIRVDSVNVYEGNQGNHTVYDGDVLTPIGNLTVGTEKISISGRSFYMGYFLQNGGDHWSEVYNCSIHQGVDGHWDDLRVDYIERPCNFVIEEDGIEHMLLKCPSSHNLITSNKVDLWIYFSRIGP